MLICDAANSSNLVYSYNGQPVSQPSTDSSYSLGVTQLQVITGLDTGLNVSLTQLSGRRV